MNMKSAGVALCNVICDWR